MLTGEASLGFSKYGMTALFIKGYWDILNFNFRDIGYQGNMVHGITQFCRHIVKSSFGIWDSLTNFTVSRVLSCSLSCCFVDYVWYCDYRAGVEVAICFIFVWFVTCELPVIFFGLPLGVIGKLPAGT